MPLPEMDTSVGRSFGLEIDGVVITAIQEVTGLKIEQDPQFKHPSDGKYVNKKLPGRPRAGAVTLTRSLTSDTSFDRWVKAAHFGEMGDARKGGAIIVYDYEGTPLKRYKLTNAWPQALELGSVRVGETTLLVEKLTITYEVLEPDL